MMGQSTEAVNDQCTLEALLIERFGVAEKERLMTHFRDHWMTERDWDLLASFGFNVVRLPFIYHLLEDEETPYTLREDAWVRLDEALREAEARGMYVILDLHGVVGSQWDQHTTGCEGQNDYWTNAEYQGRTLWLWQQIAARYKDTSTVAGYSLVNEPWGTTADNMASVMLDLYDAVRAVDPNHTIILPGHNTGIDAYGALRIEASRMWPSKCIFIPVTLAGVLWVWRCTTNGFIAWMDPIAVSAAGTSDSKT